MIEPRLETTLAEVAAELEAAATVDLPERLERLSAARERLGEALESSKERSGEQR